MPSHLSHFPGGDLVAQGLEDLRIGKPTEDALLVIMASPRLEALGFEVPELLSVSEPYGHALYASIEARMPRGAHAAYNALLDRMLSFVNSYRR